MPIFEYTCSKCNNLFEIMDLSSKFTNTACPKCGSDQIKKVLSPFATHSSTNNSFDGCQPESCGMPPGPGGMPPCGGGGCGMM